MSKGIHQRGAPFGLGPQVNIWAGFVFKPDRSAVRTVVSKLCTLPNELRPTRHGYGEDEIGRPIKDVPAFLESMSAEFPSPFLRGKRVVYDVGGGGGVSPVECACFLNVEPVLGKTLVRHMARAAPLFGYACVEVELLHRNQVLSKLDIGTCESWVGLDVRKYVPGFYWLTLVSEELAEQHGVPLAKVGDTALEHVALEDGQHLFQFFRHPDDWRRHRRTLDRLCSSLTGVFSIAELPANVTGPIKIGDLETILDPWP